MGFERFMKRLHVPPFLVDCFEGGSITRLITARQIQGAGAAILVCKDLLEQQDGKIQALDPAEYRLMFRQRLCVDACEGSLPFLFIAQGDRPIGFKGDDEVLVEGLVDEG